MNLKRLFGLIISLIGVICIAYALYSMHRIAEAKHTVSGIGKQISRNVFGQVISKKLHKKASQYDKEVRWLLIGGIVFFVAGGSIVFFYRKSR